MIHARVEAERSIRIAAEDNESTAFYMADGISGMSSGMEELLEDAGAHVGIITQNYHVYRGMLLARRVGFSQVSKIATPSKSVMQLHYLIRECVAVLKERVIRNG